MPTSTTDQKITKNFQYFLNILPNIQTIYKL